MAHCYNTVRFRSTMVNFSSERANCSDKELLIPNAQWLSRRKQSLFKPVFLESFHRSTWSSKPVLNNITSSSINLLSLSFLPMYAKRNMDECMLSVLKREPKSEGRK